ncbi:AraC family transcriptional regulator [Dyadobacter sp. LJ53]|uniref:AraC family transcriptional regulator n=1 Tax=Dyadobacter chenwenxiniae TaxID=2906456 RepID=UPI001F2C8BDF|nr:AraC family transcriptional regulator [Dyadobacter chenwenxiniae]MCF0052402.1 AraC family transcriptional regulator [Dyadobacter chenwenxiniae]
MYATIRVLRNIMYAARENGGNLIRLCGSLGIVPADLSNGEKRIEGVRPVIDLWTEVISSTKDQAFGLHLGLKSNPSTFGVLGYLMQSCQTFGDAMKEIDRYQKTVSGWITYEFVSGKECELIFSVNPLWWHASPHTARQAIDSAMSGALSYIRILTGQRIYPVSAELTSDKVFSKAVYENVFQCALKLGSDKNRLTFSKALFGMPLVGHDESLYATFAQTLQQQYAGLTQPEKFTDRVRSTIIQDFYGKIPSLEIIAAQMNVSERSFQRKLQQEHETYRSLGMKIKHELALNLLRNTNATVHAISEVLGYTEPSAFHRAFKNWTNTSPAQKKLSLE